MRRYLIGFAAGIVLGAALPVAAAELTGSSGYLHRWVVTYKGKIVCYAPYVFVKTKEIDCL